MRTAIKTIIRKRTGTAVAALLWVATGALAVADACNIIRPPTQVQYTAAMIFAAMVTVLVYCPRQSSRQTSEQMAERMEHAAEKAQVGEAATRIYELASEHFDARQQAAERPVAVGEVITDRIPALRVVRCDDVAAAKEQIYRGKVTPAAAAVPQQPRNHLAAARHPRPQP